MASNHLPGGVDLPAMSRSLFSEAAYNGIGFGLGFAVTMNPAQTLIAGSPAKVARELSPEQVQGLVVDSRTDVYSFGVTCYHMLAGKPPFTGQNAIEVALRHVNDSADAPEIRNDTP